MKKILKSLICAMSLMVVAGFTSCATYDEPLDSIPYNRVLTPLNFTAKIDSSIGNTVTFAWDGMQNAESYLLEIFRAVETENGDVAPDFDTAVPEYTETVGPEEIPFTMADMTIDITYYARVRGISSKVDPSHWAYLEGDSFTTYAARSSLNPYVSARDTKSFTIAWMESEDGDTDELTSIRVEPVIAVSGSDWPQVVSLSASDIENRAKTITDADFNGVKFAPGTNYKFTLMFGKGGPRGVVTSWTRPETGQVLVVDNAKDLADRILNADGEPEVRLLVKYNEEPYDLEPYSKKAAEADALPYLPVTYDLYLYGEPTAAGSKPVLRNVELRIDRGATKFHIEDLTFDGADRMGTSVTITTQNVVADKDGNPTNYDEVAAKLDFVEIINCEFFGNTKAIYSTAGTTGADVSKLLISGVYAHDINPVGLNGGDFIDIRNYGSHSQVIVENSTFYQCARTFLRLSDNASGNKVAMTNCTFNFVTVTKTNSNNAGIFHVRQETGVSEVTCNNCLFLNCYSEEDDAKVDKSVDIEKNEKDAVKNCWIRIARNNPTQSFAPDCENNYYFNCGPSFLWTEAITPATGAQFTKNGWKLLEDDPCTNSEGGKLYLTNDEISKNRVGDPRWWNAVQPEVKRETELTPVAETTVWAFDDKTKFESEKIAETTIIDNMRILAPAEMIMGTGLKFDQATTVSKNGVPLASAIEFIINDYGSLEITTEDAGINAALQIIVGEDRYTMVADGKAHKLIFGDIAGATTVFLLPSKAMTVKNVTWTLHDTDAEETKTALDAPKVTLAPASITEGNEDAVDVVASWAAVENAAWYTVTFNDTAYGDKFTEPTCTFAAATLNALAVGSYDITVTAHPSEVSTKYKSSEAGAAKLTVKEKPAAGAPVTLIWDFSSAEWQAALSAYGEAGKDIPNWDITIDGLQWYSLANSRWNATNIQSGNNGSTTDRYFKFTAPAVGTLKVWSSNTGGSDAPTRGVAVNVGGVETQKYGGSPSNTPQTENEFDIDKAGDVYVYAYGGGLRFYKMEFTYIDGGAVAPAEPTVWDFASAEWQAALEEQAPAAKGTNGTWTATLDGLTYTSGAGNGKWDASGFIQPNGGGNPDDEKLSRVFSFTATTGGTLKITAKSANDSEARAVNVKDASGDVQTQNVQAQEELTFDVLTAGEVRIYPGGGIRFYKFEFDGGVQK